MVEMELVQRDGVGAWDMGHCEGIEIWGLSTTQRG